MLQALKKIWPDAAAVVLFILIGFIYFFTPVTHGLVLTGEDHTGAIGSGQELTEYHQRTGEETRWTNSLFSGMPTYQMSPSYDSRTTLSGLRSIYELGLPTVMMYVFILLLGFYILMRSFGYKPWLSVLGAIAWAFSSYFFIIIGAGHIWKVLTLAFIPPTIAGMVLCFRGKYLWGGAVLALFMAFQILSNHLQMTYYFMLVMGLMFVAYLINAIIKKQYKAFGKATATIVAAIVIAVTANISNLYHTYQYSKETMRGRSELAAEGTSEKNGLSADYITQWSYGADETLTLLIPNAKGGASVPLSQSDIAMKKGQYTEYYDNFSMYWGNQPGTSGPVYVGAIIVFLFFLGLFVVKGPMKWALLAATIISILLSWGHNFMPLTQFCIDHVPFYNKFRTVSSILVIAEFTMPLLGIMALAKIIKSKTETLGNPSADNALGKNNWKFWLSLGIVGLTTFIFAVSPDIIPSTSLQEQDALAKYPEVLQDLANVHEAILCADAWRSLIYIILGATVVFLFVKIKKFPAWAMCAALIVLCLFDMFSINKRYLNNQNFVMPHVVTESFVKTPSDEQILQDKDPDFRVLNFTRNTFNENETSYFHKSIGGYSAVKLGRYQDLIDRHISTEMPAVIKALQETNGDLSLLNDDSICPVLNMLNTKYFIVGQSPEQSFALQNPHAMGNAWFVEEIKYVSTPNEEIDAIGSVNLHKCAVVDKAFESAFAKAQKSAAQDSASAVSLTKYEPNALDYEVQSANGGVVVFSEIYYPGWEATLDGQPLELGRANYMLRAAYIPAGKHAIHMQYKPASISMTETIAYIAIALLVLTLLAALAVSILGYIKKNKTQA